MAERLALNVAGWPLAFRALLILALGASTALGHLPFAIPLSTVTGLAILLALPAATPGRAAWTGWLAGTGYGLVALHWIVEPFLVDIARHGWMAPFALFFMAAGLGLFWALAFWLAERLGGGLLARVLALTGAEALRSLILTGFPWALIGHVWVGHPVAQLASLTGPHGLTLLALLIAAALVALARLGTAGIAAVAAVLAATALAPALPAPAPGPPEPAAPTIRLVQPNAPQHEKWDPDKAPLFFQRALDFTAAPGGGAPDLVVWPETSVPYFLEYSGSALPEIAAAAGDRPVVIGIQRLEEPRYYNSLVVTGPGGAPAQIYDKAHLVPFGEYMPFAGLLSRIGIHGLAANEGGGYSAGPGGEQVTLPGIGAAVPLICYEGIFAEEVRAAATDRPRLLLLITNDAWFGEFAGPYQHLAQARLRSIELGLPMVRAANTGISAIIDARGNIIAELPLGEAGFVDAPLPPALPPTLYARLGDAPILALLAIGLLALFLRRRIAVDATDPGP